MPIKIDREENMELTTDADAARTIEPIGGHKGFALAFLVEVMTSGLSGQAHSADLLQCIIRILPFVAMFRTRSSWLTLNFWVLVGLKIYGK